MLKAFILYFYLLHPAVDTLPTFSQPIKRADFKYIIGKKNTDENIPGLVGFKNAIFLVLKNEKIKLEYFKGQIFKEVFFETQNDCIEFIKVNFK